MANLFDYIAWRGDLSFAQCPVCAVDSLVFAALSYANLEVLVPDGFPSLPLQEAAEALMARPDHNKLVRSENDGKFLLTAARSPRFRSVQVCCCRAKTLEDLETQFGAMAFLLPDGSAFLAFRGTDLTLVGWKEDFNMSFQDIVPAQTEAAEYLKEFAAVFDGPMYLTGHSKGGNLSVYAAATASLDVQERIRAVYNYDGPGFGHSMIGSEGYLRMIPRIQTYVPESSIIGMLLEHEEPYSAVKSTQVSIFQHDVFTWEILGADFVRAPGVDAHSRQMNVAIKTWLEGMSRQERMDFVDTLYSILSVGGAKNVDAVLQPKNIRSMLKAIQDDEGKRRLLTSEIGEFLRIVSETSRRSRERRLPSSIHGKLLSGRK